jgi:hypothetical protein
MPLLPPPSALLLPPPPLPPELQRSVFLQPAVPDAAARPMRAAGNACQTCARKRGVVLHLLQQQQPLGLLLCCLGRSARSFERSPGGTRGIRREHAVRENMEGRRQDGSPFGFDVILLLQVWSEKIFNTRRDRSAQSCTRLHYFASSSQPHARQSLCIHLGSASRLA